MLLEFLRDLFRTMYLLFATLLKDGEIGRWGREEIVNLLNMKFPLIRANLPFLILFKCINKWLQDIQFTLRYNGS